MAHDFLLRGEDVHSRYRNFKLVGRDAELVRLSAILMRKKANSVILVGPGGVGCTALCVGLHASKQDPNAPFDIVSKRFFWLDTDGLFESGDSAIINESFQKILTILRRTPDSVLIIEDTRDFIEAVRHANVPHFINSLVLAVKKNETQIILEARDDDLEVLYKAHSDLREAFTLFDLAEPVGDALAQITLNSANSLAAFHGIKYHPDVPALAIELTTKYRPKDPSLSRAQPERAENLMDRAYSSLRMSAHRHPPGLKRLEDLAKDPRMGTNDLMEIMQGIDKLKADWADKQRVMQEAHTKQRNGEIALFALEDEKRAIEAKETAPDDRPEEDKPRPSKLASFAALASGAGIDSDELTRVKRKIELCNAEIASNKATFDKLTAEIDSQLELTTDMLLEEFSKISGIPVDKLNEDEKVTLLKLAGDLKTRVFDQDEAMDHIANQIKVARVRRRMRSKVKAKPAPVSFFLLGPSGVGKTETPKALTSLLYDDDSSLLIFDMGEYMEKHSVAKLIGAPPGYDGFDAGGILTNAMRRNPNRIILFDEVEKAHPDVFNVLLAVLSDGRLSDSVGRVVSFEDAIVIMTSNVGQPIFLDEHLSRDEMRVQAMQALEQSSFRSEFLNRFNGRENILIYHRITVKTIQKITRRTINELNDVYGESIRTHVTDDVLEHFCRAVYDPKIGARGLPGKISTSISPHIVNRLLETPDIKGELLVGYTDHQLTINFREFANGQRHAAE